MDEFDDWYCDDEGDNDSVTDVMHEFIIMWKKICDAETLVLMPIHGETVLVCFYEQPYEDDITMDFNI